MKKVLALVSVIVATSVLSIAAFDYFTGQSSVEDDVIVESLDSKILKEKRDLIIHLPDGFDSTENYPVMYVLDGSSEDQSLAEKLNVLSQAGYGPETIVVGIPNMSAENRMRNLTPPFMRMENDREDSPMGDADPFLSFLSDEVFAFMEEKYSASGERIIAGNSRGGLLVMYSLTKAPEMFSARFCFSTPFWRQDNLLAKKISVFLSAADTLKTFIYMSAGQDETENINNGLSAMERVFNEKSIYGTVVHVERTPRADHQSNARKSTASALGRWIEYRKTR